VNAQIGLASIKWRADYSLPVCHHEQDRGLIIENYAAIAPEVSDEIFIKLERALRV
jgi:hypothetical protein